MKIEKQVCDVCGADDAKTYHMPAYRTFDSRDGRSAFKEPQIEFALVDLCDKCALKATRLHSVGVMCEEYKIAKKGGDYD